MKIKKKLNFPIVKRHLNGKKENYHVHTENWQNQDVYQNPYLNFLDCGCTVAIFDFTGMLSVCRPGVWPLVSNSILTSGRNISRWVDPP